jgi:transposase
MLPEYVRTYVKARKNDDRDPEAIAEAATRPTMRFVELKSEEQLDVQTLHRVRDRLIGERTSPTNQIRSVLLERGYIVAQGHARLRLLLRELLDTDVNTLSVRMAFLLRDMRARTCACAMERSGPSHCRLCRRDCNHGPERRQSSAADQQSRHRGA